MDLKGGSSKGSGSAAVGVNSQAFITYAWEGFIWFFTWSNYYSDSNGTYNQNVSWKFYQTQTDPTTTEGQNYIYNNETPFSTAYPALGDYIRHERNSLGAGTTQYIVMRHSAQTSSGKTYTHWWHIPLYYENLGSMSMSVASNTATLSGYSGATKVIEYNRQNYNPLPAYTQEQKDIFFNTSSRGFEWGPHTSAYSDRFCKWSSGTKTIKVTHNASTTEAVRTQISNAVNNWITKTNAIIGSVVTWVRDDSATNPAILLNTGTHFENWGWTPGTDGYMYAGTWETTITNGYITHSDILINNEVSTYAHFHSPESVVMEECYQSLGAGYDLTSRADCINTEFNYVNKNPTASYNTIDTALLNMMYNESTITSNMTGIQLANAINPTYATLTTDSSDIWLGQLPTGTYNMRYWQSVYVEPVDGEPAGLHLDSITPASSWQSVAVQGRPDNWVWSSTLTSRGSNGIVYDQANNRILVLTATEWNNFIARVNLFRNWKGLPNAYMPAATQYSPCLASSVNTARLYISLLRPPTAVPSGVSLGQVITASYFNGLMNSLNSIK